MFEKIGTVIKNAVVKVFSHEDLESETKDEKINKNKDEKQGDLKDGL
jgi:hypothetical protein